MNREERKQNKQHALDKRDMWKAFETHACNTYKQIFSFILQVTFVASTHLTLDCKRQRHLSHVLIPEKCIYPLYLNKQYKSLCFSRDTRKNYSILVYTSNAQLTIPTGPFFEKCFFITDSNYTHISINCHEP